MSIRPIQTVEALATNLGLKVQLNATHFKTDFTGVQQAIATFSASGASGDVLICWEHKVLYQLAQLLGADNVPAYPDTR